MEAGSLARSGLREPEDQPPAVDLTGGVHLLPCTVKYDGPCSVSDYFKPKLAGMEVDGLTVEEAHFRGRKLQGASISFPHGYSGLVISKRTSDKTSASGSSEENRNLWEIKAKFERMTYWNHDSVPSKDDPISRSLHWLPLAEVLHKPVTPEELASSSIMEKNQND
ncbi:uncharacterized protein C12B10.15c [Punica granatum]|uniref:Uncharacterized protein n=2 Tax=Punica granatum TaxID=22663 RepID=A0A218WNH8_PUNGR|nr:uncharacterized protein C12B10.15c [Punica granatum]OWM74417.1 hypothetical protein CDL15_Pgr013321 [Punica granatum]PKI73678.1 hypothetical protein CRG98_005919 [Punica granatum]